MIKINDEYHIENRDIFKYLCHTPCKDLCPSNGYSGSIEYAVLCSPNRSTACYSCGKLTPLDTMNKLKFMFPKDL